MRWQATPRAAETVSVTSWLDSALRVRRDRAVEPPSSEIEAEPRTRETVGVPSSSVIVNVWLDGADDAVAAGDRGGDGDALVW